MKSFKNKNKIEKAANKLKRSLFDENKKQTLDICFDNNLTTRESMIYIHNLLANQEITAIITHTGEEEITRIKKELREDSK